MQQKQQKYLPPPRLRRVSEESDSKSNTPKVRRKMRRSSGDSNVTAYPTNDSSKQTQLGCLDKILSDEGESNSVSESSTLSKSSKPNSADKKVMKTKKFDIRNYNINNSTESKHLEKSLTNFMDFKFRYVSTKSSVQVAGTFNDWAPEDLYNNNDDIWTKNIRLNHATLQFKYLVDGI